MSDFISPPKEKGTTPAVRTRLAPVRSVTVTVVEGPNAGLTAANDEAIAIGTATTNDIVLTDPTVSRFHLEIRRFEEQLLVADRGSTNGTLIGPATITNGTAMVPSGTLVRLGATVVRVDDGKLAPFGVSSNTIPGMVGASRGVRRLVASIEKLAPSTTSVLINGESGTGKELVANAMHQLSARAEGPFVVLDCGAIPAQLFASELLGHERGSFTGADRRYEGALERADGGTLFLDEVGELPLEHQAVLLGVLERRRLRRLGGSTDVSVDVRVVAATHRDLWAMVNDGRFRLDLFYRIAVVALRVPPLRERRDDVETLAAHFLKELGVNKPLSEAFSEETRAAFASHPWPGNVRELKNAVHAAVATGDAPSLERVAFGGAESSPGTLDGIMQEHIADRYRDARDAVMRAFEKRYLGELLARAKGSVREAARLGEMDRSHLADMVRKHGLR